MPSILTPNGVSNVGNEKNIVFVRYRIESGFRLSRSFRIFWIDAIEGGNSSNSVSEEYYRISYIIEKKEKSRLELA